MKIARYILSTLCIAGTSNDLFAADPPMPEPYATELCTRALPLSGEAANLELIQQTGTDLPTSHYHLLSRKRFVPVNAFKARVEGSLYPIALALPETGETLVIELPKQRDLPSRRFWLFDDTGGKKAVELPAELSAPPYIDGGVVLQYPWSARYYPWASHRMFLLYTSKGLYGLREGKVWLISEASKLAENNAFDLGGGFYDLGTDLDAIVFGSPDGPTPYIVINDKKGVITSGQLPFKKNGDYAQPHPDGQSLIVFGVSRAYRVSVEGPATEILPPGYPAESGAFAGTSIRWWPGTILNTHAGFKLLTPSGALFRIRGMDRLDPRRTFFTFSEVTRRVYYATAPMAQQFGEIVTLAPGETCAD